MHAFPLRILVSAALLLASLGSRSARGQSSLCPPMNPPQNWSTWSGAPTAPGSCVVIPCGDVIVLDVVPPAMAGLDIQGVLRFSDTLNIDLTSDWIRVAGRLEVGSTAQPFTHRATITLTAAYSSTCASSAVDQTLAVEGGGVLSLHGTPRTLSWTRLALTAAAGDSEIHTTAAPGWLPGDRIVIASTDYDPSRAEEHQISSISGTAIKLVGALAYDHWGATEGAAYDGVGMEIRAEVGLLTRNVIVQGTPTIQSSGKTWAGQTRLHTPNTSVPVAEIEWAEFRNLGDEEVLGHYPFHFHMIGDASSSYIKNASFHHCWNRWVAIHETQNAYLEGNVAYDTIGHGYYFEDSTVTGCTIDRNLGVLTRKVSSGAGLHMDDKPSTFWVHNPLNTVTDNAAAGSEAHGFWFHDGVADTHPGSSPAFNHDPWIAFSGNVAHSNADSGFYGDGRPAPQPQSVFSDCLSYKNRRYGYWLRTYANLILDNCDSADNRGGYYLASEGFQTDYLDSAGDGIPMNGIGRTTLTGTLVVGVTNNNPTDWPQVAPFSCPPMPAWEALTGVELYDGLVAVKDTTFASFADAAAPTAGIRKAGAFAPVSYASPWMIDPRNYASGCTFINSGGITTTPVWLRQPVFGTSTCGQGDNGVANTIVYDLSGSITGAAEAHVVANNPFLIPASGAAYVPAWNAWNVAPSDAVGYGQLEIDVDNAYLFLWASGVPFSQLPPVGSIPYLDVTSLQSSLSYRSFAPLAGTHRFETNALCSASYRYDYPAGTPSSNWAKAFFYNFQFAEPGRDAVASMPLASPTPVAGSGVLVFYNGTWTMPSPVASLSALLSSTTNAWFYDGTAQRMWLHSFAGSTTGGWGVFDNQTTSFLVFAY